MKHNLKKEPKRKEQKVGSFRGVQERSSGRYQAKLTVDGKQKFLGTFDTKTEAACTFDQALVKYNQPLTKLNFPPQTTNDIQIKEEPRDDQITITNQITLTKDESSKILLTERHVHVYQHSGVAS